MPLVDRLYGWLSQGSTPDCDRIFAAALVHAGPPWSERIIRALLGRGHEASWAALIGHYERLTPELRAQLQQRSDRMKAGIALALRSPSADTRANALLASDEQPHIRMAYLLPDAIRDPAPRVGTLAAQVWRRMVDAFLDRPPPSADADGASCRARATERQAIILALKEALGTFDLHKRVEVLETGLWLARELGETLWNKLTSRRSPAGMLVKQHLSSWNHPRLAHFLVSALSRPEWRETAGRVLRTWKTVAELTALLRESGPLGDPEIREHLSCVEHPAWFSETDDGLTELPPELRPLAPRWVCHAVYREPERTALLSRWLRAPDPDLHRAVVYALAEVDTAGARALLRQVAESASPQASFARWCVCALDTDRVRSAMSGAGKRCRQARHGGGPDPTRRRGDLRPPPRQSAPLRPPPVEDAGQGVVTAAEADEQVQREFRAALERLSTGTVHRADADLIDRARDLLLGVYSEQCAPAQAGALRERGL